VMASAKANDELGDPNPASQAAVLYHLRTSLRRLGMEVRGLGLKFASATSGRPDSRSEVCFSSGIAVGATEVERFEIRVVCASHETFTGTYRGSLQQIVSSVLFLKTIVMSSIR